MTRVSRLMALMMMAQGQMLFKQASATRDLYFVESGTLLVHREDQNHDRVRIAMLGAGSVVGEGRPADAELAGLDDMVKALALRIALDPPR